MHKPILIAFILLAAACSKDSPKNHTPDPEPLQIRGADMSFLPEIRETDLVFYNREGEPQDMLVTLQEAGANVIRLRLWKNPEKPTSALPQVKDLAREIQQMGMQVMLTVHYSDHWADPGKQPKPAQWEDISFQALKDSVHAYSKQITAAIAPAYIQVGNEINNGLLWPDGHSDDPAQMQALLQEGIAGVRDAGTESQIILHYAGFKEAEAFFRKLSGLDYDIAGLSYYPHWHGKDTAEFRQHVRALPRAIQKPVFIAETAYPFTLKWNDQTNNIIGMKSQILEAFPPTPQGQKDFLLMQKTLMQKMPQGLGFCYWGAEFVSYKGNDATNGSSWENQALWNFGNYALPAMEAFK